jgi:hypothetical protein
MRERSYLGNIGVEGRVTLSSLREMKCEDNIEFIQLTKGSTGGLL